jgi:hypothetical protein
MISSTEFRSGVRGVLHLARFDKRFLGYFDRSAAGARRSFWLALIIWPLALVVYWIDIDQTVPSAGVYLVARSVGYAYGWILFPMLILVVGRLLGREAEAPGAIAVYNWFSLLWVALQIPVTILFAINPDSSLGTALGVVFLLYSMAIEGFFLMRCLQILVWQAAILVFVDIVLSLYLIAPAARQLGSAPLP